MPTPKKIIFGILGVLLFALVAMCPCPDVMAETAVAAGNTPEAAMVVLGSVCFAVCWWVGSVAPDWVTAFLMVCSWSLFGACSIEASFASFSGSTLWMIIGAFMIAAAVNKTGLLRRIALYLMTLFPPKFAAQIVALMVAGTVCAPLIPSASAKGILGGSMAYNIAEALEYKENSKSRTALFMAAWIGFVASTPAFLTGSAFSYIIKGYMPTEIQAQLTWTNWFVALLPWLIIFLVLMYISIMVLYHSPKSKKSVDKSFLYEQIKDLGKMDRQEKITAVILVPCLILWVLEKQVGVGSTTTAVIGGALMFVFGVLDTKDLRSRLNWGLIIFIGSVFCLGTMFADMGISAWVSSLLNPLLSSVNSTVALVIILFLLVYVIRFFIVSQTVVIGLMLGIMMPLMGSLGIHPFLVGIMLYMAVDVWFVLYQNTTYLAAYGTMEGTIIPKDAAKCSAVYALVVIAASVLSLPYWQYLGYIS